METAGLDYAENALEPGQNLHPPSSPSQLESEYGIHMYIYILYYLYIYIHLLKNGVKLQIDLDGHRSLCH